MLSGTTPEGRGDVELWRARIDGRDHHRPGLADTRSPLSREHRRCCQWTGATSTRARSHRLPAVAPGNSVRHQEVCTTRAAGPVERDRLGGRFQPRRRGSPATITAGTTTSSAGVQTQPARTDGAGAVRGTLGSPPEILPRDFTKREDDGTEGLKGQLEAVGPKLTKVVAQLVEKLTHRHHQRPLHALRERLTIRIPAFRRSFAPDSWAVGSRVADPHSSSSPISHSEKRVSN